MASMIRSAVAHSEKMNNKLWITLGVILWVLFVLSKIPAVWGAWLITKGTDQLALSGVSGSFWNGSASLASLKIEQNDYTLGELKWNIKPLSLLLLKPCADIATNKERQEFTGEVCAGLGGSIQLHDADLIAPAALFKSALPLPIEGQFSAHIDHLTLNNQKLESLAGSLSWGSARIYNGNNWMGIGTYGADISDDGNGGIKATINNVEGPVTLQLQAVLLAGGGGNVKGNFSLSQAFADEVKAGAWVSMFAQADGTDEQGNTRYTVDTNL